MNAEAIAFLIRADCALVVAAVAIGAGEQADIVREFDLLIGRDAGIAQVAAIITE